ncbi:uncharacterized protein SCHCODRAFT_02589708 [Schizophyllum commune H4-8]|nr:uncharacterized protein SCHCODRAFT_02589708 [Schizophyllum commune H4-8]KAI5887959.1 hypothetical protein SCHCODRAFT_02589708 [Schizophyllum commune H4-8]
MSNDNADSTKPAEPLLLEDKAANESVTRLDVDGNKVPLLDELGPMVVNSDGTLSRIANWTEMTEAEKKNTLRVLSKRNQLRLVNAKEASGNAAESA